MVLPSESELPARMLSPQPPAKPFEGELRDEIADSRNCVSELLAGQDQQTVTAVTKKSQELILLEFREKMKLLLDHYEVPRDAPDRWEILAFSLASQFVPGFKLLPMENYKTPGAPSTWPERELILLYLAVQEITDQDVKAREACRRLLKDDGGAWRYGRARSSATLYRRYQEAKNLASVRAIMSAEDEQTRQRLIASITETGQD